MRRNPTLTALALASALVWPAALAAQSFSEPRSLKTEEKAIIAQAVRKGLSRPEEARFRWYQFNGGKQYCGLVNAKTEAGEEIGLRTFLIDVVPSSTGQIFAATNPTIIDPNNRIATTMTEICLSTTIDEDTNEPIAPPTR